MTTDHMNAIRQRLQCTTPGEWYETKTTKRGKFCEYSKFPFEMPDNLLAPDQRFIGHAKEDMENLLAEVVRLKQLCLKAANHKWGEYLGNGDMVMRDLLRLEVE